MQAKVATKNGGIWTVTLDRPKANAIALTTSQVMGRHFQAFRDDPGSAFRIVKNTGKNSSLLVGLKAAAGSDSVTGDYGVGGFTSLQELRDMNKPIIARVEGMAVGSGFELMLSCDLIYCTQASTLLLKSMQVLADTASIKLPKRIPYHVAMDMLLTGRWMDSAEAARWGLVNEVLDDRTALEARVQEIATLLKAAPSFQAIKETVKRAGRRFKRP